MKMWILAPSSSPLMAGAFSAGGGGAISMTETGGAMRIKQALQGFSPQRHVFLRGATCKGCAKIWWCPSKIFSRFLSEFCTCGTNDCVTMVGKNQNVCACPFVGRA